MSNLEPFASAYQQGEFTLPFVNTKNGQRRLSARDGHMEIPAIKRQPTSIRQDNGPYRIRAAPTKELACTHRKVRNI